MLFFSISLLLLYIFNFLRKKRDNGTYKVFSLILCGFFGVLTYVPFYVFGLRCGTLLGHPPRPAYFSFKTYGTLSGFFFCVLGHVFRA